MTKSSNSLIAFCLIFYYWIKGIILFFIPKSLRYKSVKDELVLITGGGSGLGRALALRFAKLDANVVVWDINESGLVETVKLVKELGTNKTIKSYVCDITDRRKVYETAAKVKQDVGVVTILVNNAGVVNGKNLLDIPDEKILQTFQVNAISHFWTVKAFLPDMMSKNSGHFVTIGKYFLNSFLSKFKYK
jgi:all-trans-retinol dehydrogenase (NAD+)